MFDLTAQPPTVISAPDNFCRMMGYEMVKGGREEEGSGVGERKEEGERGRGRERREGKGRDLIKNKTA